MDSVPVHQIALAYVMFGFAAAWTIARINRNADHVPLDTVLYPVSLPLRGIRAAFRARRRTMNSACRAPQ